jgi:hypothetical protein
MTSGTRVPAFDYEKWSSHQRETYGEFIRNPSNRSKLSRDERKFLAKEAEWEKENPGEAEALDLCVGRDFVLNRTMNTFAEDLEEMVSSAGVPSYYPSGLTLHIFARVGDRLMGRTGWGTILLVKRSWLNLDDSVPAVLRGMKPLPSDVDSVDDPRS